MTCLVRRALRRARMVALLFALAGPSEAFGQGRSEANEHFEKGVAAFRAKRLLDAVAEFEQAYRISPAYQVLYNIGMVDVALDRHADACRALTSYLADGGSAIFADRKAGIEAELERQR